MSLREHVARKAVPLLGRIRAVLQRAREIHVRTHNADNALGLVANLQHRILTAGRQSGIQQDGCIGCNLFLLNMAVSWH